MGRVQDKVAIITGAASGVGAEDARLLAAEGARVVLTDINVQAGAALAAELGERALFIAHDIADENQWQQVIATTEQHFGGLDVLVNNAAILRAGNLADTDLAQWQMIQSTNAQGYFLGCKYALGAMQRRGGGSIINMSSLAAVMGMSAFLAYSAAKGAVSAMTRSIAAYCKQQELPIRCNAVCPDGIRTPMIVDMHKHAAPGQLPQPSTPQDMKKALSRMAEPRDIANLVLFLASDESRFFNGAELRVDNGWSVWGD